MGSTITSQGHHGLRLNFAQITSPSKNFTGGKDFFLRLFCCRQHNREKKNTMRRMKMTLCMLSGFFDLIWPVSFPELLQQCGNMSQLWGVYLKTSKVLEVAILTYLVRTKIHLIPFCIQWWMTAATCAENYLLLSVVFRFFSPYTISKGQNWTFMLQHGLVFHQ